MSRFEDHLWREVEHEHGHDLEVAKRPPATHKRARTGVLAGSTLGLAGLGTALLLILGATTTSPAFAVTRNHDGTITVWIQRTGGIAGANAKLRQLGIRARVVVDAPVGCTAPSPMAGHGVPAPPHGNATAQWTIDPRQVPVGRTLALTPPPGANTGNSGNSGNSGTADNSGSRTQVPISSVPSGNSGNSGNSGTAGNSGSRGQVAQCPTWTVRGAPAPGAGNSGNSGSSGNS